MTALAEPPAQTLARPYSIGGIVVDPPVVLAPMADVTNGAFRRICKRIGQPGLIVTEQISTAAIHYRNAKTLRMFDWTPVERPLGVQLFGSDPDMMAEAAKIVADYGADLVDINMGCWVPKVCRTGAGAALLKDEPTALKVVQAVVDAVDVPVTVKMRVGWSLSQLTSIPLALKFQDLGVQGFALHGRTAQQGFNGNADWDWIAEMKAALRMPVTGNGDVKTPEQAEEMLRVTGCDGVMIGRAAIGNPWILREVGHYLRTGEHLPPPTLRERVDTALEHVRSLAEVYGEENAVRHLRGQVPIYIKGFRGANHAREQIVRVLQIDEVERILMSVIEENANEHV